MSALETFRSFLERFNVEYLSIPLEERPIPFRLVEDSISYSEVVGYCREWAAQYLYYHKCPVHLMNLICAEVITRIKKADVNQYVLVERPQDDGGNECASSKTTPPEAYYRADGLCRLTFDTVDEIAGNWLESLPEEKLNFHTNQMQVLSYHAIKNTRRKMEDRHVIVPCVRLYTDKQELSDTSLYAVFDGHGGPDAAYYSSAQFLHNLIAQSGENKSQALIRAFSLTDLGFSSKSTREKLLSGSTAVAVLVDPQAIHVAWLGDTQAVLVKSGVAERIMNPHTPERLDERARIESLGGCVIWFGTWRVNGTLAVSRAIGDVEHKPYVSSTPDINSIPRTDSDEYLIIACDGLWDTVTPPKAAELVYNHIDSGGSHESVADLLVKHAKSEGSTDNITVIVVFFKKAISRPVPVEEKAVLASETCDEEDRKEDSPDEPLSDDDNQAHPHSQTDTKRLPGSDVITPNVTKKVAWSTATSLPKTILDCSKNSAICYQERATPQTEGNRTPSVANVHKSENGSKTAHQFSVLRDIVCCRLPNNFSLTNFFNHCFLKKHKSSI